MDGLTVALLLGAVGAAVLFASWATKQGWADRAGETNTAAKRAEVLERLRARALGVVHMEYGDADGVLTRRTVLITDMEVEQGRDGVLQPTRLQGYCMLRRDMRNFLVRRVETLFRDGEPWLRTHDEITAHFRAIADAARQRSDVTQEETTPPRCQH